MSLSSLGLRHAFLDTGEIFQPRDFNGCMYLNQLITIVLNNNMTNKPLKQREKKMHKRISECG